MSIKNYTTKILFAVSYILIVNKIFRLKAYLLGEFIYFKMISQKKEG